MKMCNWYICFCKQKTAYEMRISDWSSDVCSSDLITGPVDRKMIINALNSGAYVFMADFEDASTPSWENMIDGQFNLRDANKGSIDFTDPTSGKAYKPGPTPARSEERRVGKECVCTFRSRWSRYH